MNESQEDFEHPARKSLLAEQMKKIDDAVLFIKFHMQ